MSKTHYVQVCTNTTLVFRGPKKPHKDRVLSRLKKHLNTRNIEVVSIDTYDQ